MSSLLTRPLRLGLTATRASLRITRDLAERGLDLVDLIASTLTAAAPAPEAPSAPQRPPTPPQTPPPPPPAVAEAEIVDYDAPTPPVPVHVSEEAEIVEAVAEPGAEDGAGAQITILEPFPGYNTLRAADVIERLGSLDAAALGAVELYETTHRRRQTVLRALAREARRPR